MRFSLRTLLIAVTCVALCCGLILRPVLRRGALRKRIHASGGSVHTSYEDKSAYWQFMSRFFDDRHIYLPTSVSFVASDVSGKGLAFLRHCRSLRSISLQSCNIGDELVQKLAALPRLESLNLSDTLITDKALDHLEDSKLEQLLIGATSVSRERALAFKRATRGRIEVNWSPGISADERVTLRELQRNHYLDVTYSAAPPESSEPHLAPYSISLASDDDDEEVEWLRPLLDLKQLTRLSLTYGVFSAKECEILGQLDAVDFLYVDESYFHDVTWLSGMNKLEALLWYESNVDNPDWSCLRHLPHLQVLKVRWPVLEDEDFANLPEGQPLTTLDLWNVEITNASVPLISTFRHLEKLSLDDTEIDQAGYRQIMRLYAKTCPFTSTGNPTILRNVMMIERKIVLANPLSI